MRYGVVVGIVAGGGTARPYGIVRQPLALRPHDGGWLSSGVDFLYIGMIIALDETGDFRVGSKAWQFFVGAHVREGKEAQYKKWEKRLPRHLKGGAGEFKGATLPEQYLADFVDEVLVPHPQVRITPEALVPEIQLPEHIDSFRDVTLATMNDLQLQARKVGDSRSAAQSQAMANWFRKLSVPQLLKLVAMVFCATHALMDSVAEAWWGGYDLELADLEFKVDRDFIREPTHQNYWMQILRASFQASEKSLASPSTWPIVDHPFKKLYGLGSGWDFTVLFTKKTCFLDSKKHFELRIADIVAAILRRAFAKTDCESLLDRVRLLFTGPNHTLHFALIYPTAKSLRQMAREGGTAI
jgi:hypothetical protein